MDTSGKDKQEEPEKPEKFEETEDSGSEEKFENSGSEMKSKDSGSTVDTDEWEFAISKEGFEAEVKRVWESMGRPDVDLTPETMKTLQIEVEKDLDDVFRRANAIARLDGRVIVEPEDFKAAEDQVKIQNGEKDLHQKEKNNK